jgi:hypothetical protein
MADAGSDLQLANVQNQMATFGFNSGPPVRELTKVQEIMALQCVKDAQVTSEDAEKFKLIVEHNNATIGFGIEVVRYPEYPVTLLGCIGKTLLASDARLPQDDVSKYMVDIFKFMGAVRAAAPFGTSNAAFKHAMRMLMCMASLYDKALTTEAQDELCHACDFIKTEHAEPLLRLVATRMAFVARRFALTAEVNTNAGMRCLPDNQMRAFLHANFIIPVSRCVYSQAAGVPACTLNKAIAEEAVKVEAGKDRALKNAFAYVQTAAAKELITASMPLQVTFCTENVSQRYDVSNAGTLSETFKYFYRVLMYMQATCRPGQKNSRAAKQEMAAAGGDDLLAKGRATVSATLASLSPEDGK